MSEQITIDFSFGDTGCNCTGSTTTSDPVNQSLVKPPNDLAFSVPSFYMAEGDNTVQLPVTFKGWRIRVLRDNIPVDYTEQVAGDPYFTRDTVNNTLWFSIAATSNNKFVIQAY